MDWRPDIIHCNDWQSALVIAYLKVLYKDDPFFKRTAAVYSVHNLGYLGMFPKVNLAATGLGLGRSPPRSWSSGGTSR